MGRSWPQCGLAQIRGPLLPWAKEEATSGVQYRGGRGYHRCGADNEIPGTRSRKSLGLRATLPAARSSVVGRSFSALTLVAQPQVTQYLLLEALYGGRAGDGALRRASMGEHPDGTQPCSAAKTPASDGHQCYKRIPHDLLRSCMPPSRIPGLRDRQPSRYSIHGARKRWGEPSASCLSKLRCAGQSSAKTSLRNGSSDLRDPRHGTPLSRR